MSQNISNFNDEVKAFLNGYVDFTKNFVEANLLNGAFANKTTTVFFIVDPINSIQNAAIRIQKSNSEFKRIFYNVNGESFPNFYRLVVKIEQGDSIEVILNTESLVNFNPDDFVFP